jgi:VacB/RNase II family 3'-5' exoribonuclease
MKEEYKKLLLEVKQNIENSRKKYEGVVEGLVGYRIGFLKREDQKTSLVIPPLEMDKVLPGDKVRVLVVQEKGEDKLTIEELIETKLKTFTGQFIEDETGAYVIPDVIGLNRKIRVPKSYTKKAQNNDFVYVEILEHPFTNKKPKAKVLEIISPSNADMVEIKYSAFKNKIKEDFKEETLKEVDIFDENFISEKGSERKDLRNIPFITIDSESTTDIDDAVYVEYKDNQWKLYVAIADVTEFVIEGSRLDIEAKERTSSVYYLGKNIPMIPPKLSSELCSLMEGKDRLAMVCEIDFNENGDMVKYNFYEALVNSKAKMNYNEVEDYINGDDSFVSKYGELSKVIFNLYHLHNLLKKNREINSVLQEYGDDFKIILDSHKKIKDIQKLEIKTSQKMIEECMVITNIAAAMFLTKNYDEGIYRVHDGIKDNKVGEVKAILNKAYPEFDVSLLFSLEGFKKLMDMLSKDENGLRIKKIILNNMKKSQFNKKQLGHFCMGFEEYTYFTSPIRRYVDVIVHRLIKNSLKNEKRNIEIDTDLINENLSKISRSTREVEDWLKSQYLEKNFKGKKFKALVTSIENSAIRFKVIENGIEGVYLITKEIKASEGFNLNKPEQKVVLNDKTINLLQIIEVEYDKFDFINKRNLFKNMVI